MDHGLTMIVKLNNTPMYTIKIKGEAEAHLENYNGDKQELTLEQLIQCNDVKIETEFVEYCDEVYAHKLIKGYTHFEVNNGKLYSVCLYEANQKLTDEELKLLTDYTQGQWSDGIGEGFEQFSCREIDNSELYISPWIPFQSCTVEQVKSL